MIVRAERPSDFEAIAALTHAAFRGAEHTDGTEHLIPARLRDSADLTLSLVVEADGDLVGHVAFSPVEISDGTSGWHGLGPVAVIPDLQSRGIGTTLIGDGLDRLQDGGSAGCVVLGEPDFYQRFGFTHDPALSFPGPPALYFQRIVFRGPPPNGVVRYSRAFQGST